MKKTLTINLDEELYDNITALHKIAPDMTIEAAALDGIRHAVARFTNGKGRVNPVKGTWEGKPCWILEYTTIFSEPYAKIYMDGQIFSAPKSGVEEESIWKKN